jgi:hypothetical protein
MHGIPSWLCNSTTFSGACGVMEGDELDLKFITGLDSVLFPVESIGLLLISFFNTLPSVLIYLLWIMPGK